LDKNIKDQEEKNLENFDLGYSKYRKIIASFALYLIHGVD